MLFLDWCQRAGFCNLEDIEPIHVAAYIEQHSGSAATIQAGHQDAGVQYGRSPESPRFHAGSLQLAPKGDSRAFWNNLKRRFL
jgi:hypothetical protein